MGDRYCCARSARGEMCSCPVIQPPVREEPCPCGGTGINIFGKECVFCRGEKSDQPPTDDKDALLKRSAEVLKSIRLKAANWAEYPGARQLLDDLYSKGYA